MPSVTRWSFAVAALAGTLAFASPAAQAQPLNQECTASVLNRYTRVAPDGTFALANVPVPLGAFRVRMVCERASGATERGNSDYTFGVPNGETPVLPIGFGPEEDPIPVRLLITSPATVFTPARPGAQLVTTGYLVNGVGVDLTLADTGTRYISSNTAIATVTPDGLVSSTRSGTFLVTAAREGLIATIVLRAELTTDADGDGIPDDFERGHDRDPGGVLLSRQPGVTVVASSAVEAPERVIDGSLNTSWTSRNRDAVNRGGAPFIELVLPQESRLAQIRLFGDRERRLSPYRVTAGRFQAWNAAGALLYDSGPRTLSALGDLALGVDLAAAKRVRFTPTGDLGPMDSIGEIQLYSGPGGGGLDANNAADAALDFDGDGLTNLQEFLRGTDLFAADSDADGASDGAEVALGSSPLLPDTDRDGLADGAEPNPGGDFDGDQIINVLDPDADNDGLPDGLEVRLRLDPQDADTDNDFVTDQAEDSDGDRFPNFEELAAGTDPGNPDSDGDGAVDGAEVFFGCNPREAEQTTLAGRVTDAAGNPLAGARVYLAGQLRSTLTDAAGAFQFGTVSACPAALRLVAEQRTGASLLRGEGAVTAVVGGATDASTLVLRPFNGPAFANARLTVGSGPAAVEAGDLDGDGVPELVVALEGQNQVAVFTGAADRGYGAPRLFATGTGPKDLALLDLDADGRLDVVTANAGSNDLTVLRGLGDGSFAAASTVALPAGALSLSFGLLDRDLYPDLVVAGAVSLSVLLSRGDGTFQPLHNCALAGPPRSIAVADWNGDGLGDVAVAQDQGLVFLAGRGDGSFDPARSASSLPRLQSLVAVDVDQDGLVDLLATQRFASILIFLLGNGDGSFQQPVTFPAAANSKWLSTGDFDHDGRVDAALASEDSSGATLFYGTGDFHYFTDGLRVATGTPARALAVADFDLDGRADLASAQADPADSLTLTYGSGLRSFFDQNRLTQVGGPTALAAGRMNADPQLDLLFASDGAFSAFGLVSFLANPDGSYGRQTFQSGPAVDFAWVDFDSDGIRDALVANSVNNSVTRFAGQPDGGFVNLGAVSVGSEPVALAAGDFDGDGVVDAATTSTVGNDVSLLLGRLTGGFEPVQRLPLGAAPTDIAAGDLDGDGNDDLAVTVAAGVALLHSNGDGTFAAPVVVAAGTGPTSLLLADLDGDGHLDLAVANAGSRSLTVLLGNGTGSFLTARTSGGGGGAEIALPTAPRSVSTGDANGDGLPDLLVASRDSGDVTVLVGDGAGNFTESGRFAAAPGTLAALVGDADGDGLPDLVAANRSDASLSVVPQLAALPTSLISGDSEPPVVALTAPAAGTVIYAGEAQVLAATARDNLAVRSVSFSVDGQALSSDTSAPYQARLSGLAAGTYRLLARAVDTAGNSTDSPEITLEVRDNQAPQVAILSPAEGTQLQEGTSATLEASASDDGAVASVAFRLDGALLATATAPPYRFTFTVPTGASSTLAEVVATDDRGAQSTASRSYPVVADPLTTVTGRVVDTQGVPVEGVAVSVFDTFTSVSDASGNFSIPSVPTVRGAIVVLASKNLPTGLLFGRSAPFAPVPGGTTAVGNVVVRDDFTFTDPQGDQQDFAGPDFDIRSVVVDPDGANVRITVEVGDPMIVSRTSALLSFDLDQNPATGTASPIDARSPYGTTGLGSELELAIVRGRAADGETPISWFPDASSPTSFTLTVPLARLGGDIQLNLAVAIYNDFAPTQIDVAPNGSFFSIPPDLDSDGDGLPDAVEVRLDLDRFNPDTDGDGEGDALEDFDHDALANGRELALGTDPTLPDSDLDGLADGAEVDIHHTLPLVRDTDGGGRGDGVEVLFDGTNPLDPGDDRHRVQVNEQSSAFDPALALDAAGRVHAAWSFACSVYYALLTPGGEKLIGETPILDSCSNNDDLSLAVDSSGRVHLLWNDPARGVVYSVLDPSRDDQDGSPADLGSLEVVAPLVLAAPSQGLERTSISEARMALDPADRVHVIWLQQLEVETPAEQRLPVTPTLVRRSLGEAQPGLHYLQLGANGEERVRDRLLADSSRIYVTKINSNGDTGARMAIAADTLGVHVVATDGGYGGNGAKLFYLELAPADGAVRIDATDLLSGAAVSPANPSLGLARDGKVSLVYQDYANEAAEVFSLQLDPGLDDRDGSPAVPAQIFTVTPHFLTFPDGIHSLVPRAAFDRDGNPFFTYYEGYSFGSFGDLFARGATPLGLTLLPRQAVTENQSVIIPGRNGAAVAYRQPSMYLMFNDRSTAGDGVISFFVVNPDRDGDGLGDAEEVAAGLALDDPDTDNDGLSDGFEVRYGFDPHQAGEELADGDGDGLNNLEEQAAGSDPLRADTDGDGLSDGTEVHSLSSSPNDRDSDRDGLADGDEVNQYGSSPTREDTDSDGLPDGYEVAHGLAPSDPADGTADLDGDGLTGGQEYQLGSDPTLADSDGDGLLDGAEVAAGTSPIAADTDGDFLSDGFEATLGSSGSTFDSDGGGRGDGGEYFDGSDPNQPADDRPAVELTALGSSVNQGAASVVDSSGNLHLVWASYSPDDFCSELYYSLRAPSGATLIAATPLTFDCSEVASPSLAIGAAGRVEVVFNSSRDQGIEVYLLVLDPALDDQDGSAADPGTLELAPPALLSDPDFHESRSPRFAVDGNGDLHVVWVDRYLEAGPDFGRVTFDHIFYTKVNSLGGSLLFSQIVAQGPEFQANGGIQPAVAVDSAGNPHIAWTGTLGTETGLYYAMLDGATGDVRIAPTRLVAGAGALGYASLGFDANQELSAVYQNVGSAGAREVFSLGLDPSLDDQNGDAASPALIVNLGPAILSADDGRFSCNPTAVVAADGSLGVSFFEQASEVGGLGRLVAAAWSQAGTLAVPIQPIADGAPFRVDAGRQAPLSWRGVELAVSWGEEDVTTFETRVLFRLANPDDDHDGLANWEERVNGTNPNQPDTDGGGASDGKEVKVDGTDPLDPGDDLP
ncbi:MAG: FG-GAP-like repeat-containing protein [Thermoanaerobaculia bacterium]